MEITSGGTDGPRLGAELSRAANNVYGRVLDDRSLEELARAFVSAGWRARKSSHVEYEVEHTWARLELFRDADGTTVFSGVVASDRRALLAGTFGGPGLNVRFDEDG